MMRIIFIIWSAVLVGFLVVAIIGSKKPFAFLFAFVVAVVTGLYFLREPRLKNPEKLRDSANRD